MNPFQPFALAHVDYGKPGQAWRETNLGCSKESIVREMTRSALDFCELFGSAQTSNRASSAIARRRHAAE